MTWFLILMSIMWAIDDQAKPGPMLILEKIIIEPQVQTFALHGETDHWATTTYTTYDLWKEGEKVASVPTRIAGDAIWFGADTQTLYADGGTIDFDQLEIQPLSRLWDVSYRATINDLAPCDDGKHMVAYTVVRPMKTLDRSPDPLIGSKIQVINLETGTSKIVLQEDGSFLTNRMALATQGDLAVAGFSGISAWNWQTGEILYQEDQRLPIIRTLDFLADKHLVGGDNDGNLKLWHTDTWELLTQFKTDFDRITQMECHPSGDWVACIGKENWVEVMGYKGGQFSLQQRIRLEEPILNLAWAKNGEKLYLLLEDRILVYGFQ